MRCCVSAWSAGRSRRDELQLRQQFRDIDGLRGTALTEGVLVSHVARDRKKICLRAFDDGVLIHPHQAQEHLLRQVRHIRDISCAGREKTPQTLTVLDRQPGDKRGLVIVPPHACIPEATVSLR